MSTQSVMELKVIKEGGLTFLNWNIGGAKFLELKGGPPEFRESHIGDPIGLLDKIYSSSDPLCRYLKEKIGLDKQRLKKSTAEGSNLSAKWILSRLNEILKIKDLYDVERFKHVRLSNESRQWISLTNSKKPAIREHRRRRFNYCLLKDAFPEINLIPETRDEFQDRLQEAFSALLRDTPDIITLQEIVCYESGGKKENAIDVLKRPEGYDFFPHWLIDTERHSHQGKWT